MELKGRHVLVTGAAKRLGKAIAEHLLEYPIRMSAHYFRSEAEAHDIEKFAKHHGRELALISADLSDPSQILSLVDHAEKKLGPIDILINNASLFFQTPALACKVDDWDRLFNVNLRAPFLLAQQCARRMISRGGVIINMADANAERTMKEYVPYVVSKAALMSLTRNLACEWAPSIRVNAISPGPILAPQQYAPEEVSEAARKTLLGRWGQTSDITRAVIFLIEDDYVTGVSLNVDGGRSLRA